MAGAEGSNTIHQKKNLDGAQRLEIAKNFGIPLTDEAIKRADFYKPVDSSPEIRYLKARRKELGGPIPRRVSDCQKLSPPALEKFDALIQGSGDRPQSSTMSMVRILSILLREKSLNKYIVPIVPDEARTFGLEALFKIAGIFSLEGQRYTPVDADTIVAYREAEDGQILQEGICETGAMASFQAAGSAYAVHGVPTIPFYIFYSMFGFQRVGDMIWSCADMMCRGFLLGGTAGRTTLNGEGLQHEDGHSHVLATTVPNLKSYDPAFAYELALIVRDGIYRMYEQQENIFYYITVYNENYAMPAMGKAASITDGILKGAYCWKRSKKKGEPVHLLSSGSIMQQAQAAAAVLEEMGYAATIWSVTSFSELAREAEACERYNRLNPLAELRSPYIRQLFAGETGPMIAVTDYMKALPNSISRWMPASYTTLGTDGFGLSDSREDLRDHFEICHRHIVQAALVSLYRDGKIAKVVLKKQLAGLKINADKPNPMAR